MLCLSRWSIWIVLLIGAAVLFAVIKMTGDRQCWLWLTLPVLFLCGYFCCESTLNREEYEHTLIQDKSCLEQGATADNTVATGRVVKLTIRENRKEYLLEAVKVGRADMVTKPVGRLHVRLSSDFAAIEGDRISVTGRLSVFEKPTNPGQFDYGAYQGALGTFLMMEGSKGGILVKGERRMDGWFGNLRRYLVSALVEYGGESGGTMAALVLGDKTYLPDERSALYMDSGIGHILTLSGLHLSLFGVGLYGLLRKRLTAAQWPAALLVTGGIWAYICLIGGGISATRAAIALIVSLLAGCLGKTYDSLSAAALGMMMILAEYPMQITRPSFWLSFGAVFAMGGMLPAIKRWLEPAGKTGKWTMILLPPLVIQMALMPVTAINQYTMQSYSVFLNLLVVPMMGILLGGCIIILVLSMIVPDMAWILAVPVNGAFEGLDFLCRSSMKLPWSIMAAGHPCLMRLAIYGLILGGTMIHIYRRNRLDWEAMEHIRDEEVPVVNEKTPGVGWKSSRVTRLRRWVALLFIWILLSLTMVWRGGSGYLSMVFLDVGQGDSIFLETPNGTTLLVDCGSSSERKLSEYVMEPFFRWEGVGHLDYLVLTHMDADHVNGVEGLLASGISVGTLLVSSSTTEWDEVVELCSIAGDKLGKVVRISENDRIVCGKVEITCICPQKEIHVASENEASVVLQINYGDFSCLLTGDLEGAGEERLISYKAKKQDDPGITLLKVAHHGSRYSTSEELLDLIDPAAAVISCGEGNSYGHPHEELLDRLEMTGCSIYCTSDCGAVLVETDGKRWKIEGMLE